MIRFFTTLRNTIFEHSSDETIFREATDGFQHHGEKCPGCGAAGRLSPYGDYSRNLVSHNGETTVELRVSPRRFKCASCGRTHALIPDILIPYSPYSIRFKLAVLLAYFERNTTVVAICERFRIAVSTLYEWKKRLLEHKELLLGLLVSKKEPVLTFLHSLFGSNCLSGILRCFFHRHAFSFLQNRAMTAARSLPP